jgi:glycosyltransferase involved in cell wall biosynthesis
MVQLLTDYQIVVYECDGYKPIYDINKKINIFTAKTITPDIIPDVVVCQYIEYHYETCRQIADTYGCPLIIVEHNAPYMNKGIHNAIKNDGVVFYSNEHYGLWVENEYGSTTVNKRIENAVVIPPTGVRDKNSNTHGIISIFKTKEMSLINDVLYAMANKNCVIAPQMWEINKAIKNLENGIFFDPRDPHSIQKITDYLEKDYALRKDIAKNALSTVEQKYSNASFTENWYKILERVLL